MTIFQAIILGITQGATEFLPVSSSGHLIIIPKLFGWSEQPLVFDTTMHLATASVLILVFWKDLWTILKSLTHDLRSSGFKLSLWEEPSKMFIKIILSSIPAGVAGLLLNDFIEQKFRDVHFSIIFVLFGTLLMIAAEYKHNKNKTTLSYSVAFVLGLFQSLALFPGVSRSGATISGGMLTGLNREVSARFSFLLSIPIVVLAGLYELKKAATGLTGVSIEALIVGFISSFLVGLVSVRFLLNYLKKNTLIPFVIYRLILVLIILALI
jgi:undecaprenyl-diphosphatase